MLNIENLDVAYGDSQILRGVSLEVGAAEIVVVVGRNGVGKTTLLKSLIGILPSRSGKIELDGVDITRMRSYSRVRHGLAYVPQGRMIFASLTVEENIRAGMSVHANGKGVPEYIYQMFPVLKQMSHRKGGNLSGGQQQMLAIARALVAKPKLLLLDEPTEGIQPSIIKELAVLIKKMRTEYGFGVLVSEQVLNFALEIADRVVVMERGEIVLAESIENVSRDVIKEYLAV